MNICPKCGATVFPGATDCPNCGHLVDKPPRLAPASNGNFVFKLAGLIAISPLLPLAIGVLGNCGNAMRIDLLCASSPESGYSIAAQGFIWGVFGFLFTIPAGVVLALLGLLLKSMQSGGELTSATSSQAVDASADGRTAAATDVVDRRFPTGEDPQSGNRRTNDFVPRARLTWLRAAGIVLVALGVLCLSRFIYQDGEKIRESFLGALAAGTVGLSLLLSGAICLTRSREEERSVKRHKT